MLELTMDVEQYDCPFIDTTDDHEVSFSALQWSFDERRRQLETRIVMEGADAGALDLGLDSLRSHPNFHSLELLTRKPDRAVIRTIIGETDAMAAIRSNDGYITGPFHIEDGSEIWQVGFDDEARSTDALADLDEDNEFTIEQRKSVDVDDLVNVLRNLESAASILSSIDDLSDVERETLSAAMRLGYFEEPREATLNTLAGEFDVSDTAVSKNMRRAERKLLPSILSVDDTDIAN